MVLSKVTVNSFFFQVNYFRQSLLPRVSLKNSGPVFRFEDSTHYNVQVKVKGQKAENVEAEEEQEQEDEHEEEEQLPEPVLLDLRQTRSERPIKQPAKYRE